VPHSTGSIECLPPMRQTIWEGRLEPCGMSHIQAPSRCSGTPQHGNATLRRGATPYSADRHVANVLTAWSRQRRCTRRKTPVVDAPFAVKPQWKFHALMVWNTHRLWLVALYLPPRMPYPKTSHPRHPADCQCHDKARTPRERRNLSERECLLFSLDTI
jgi:hypothetical protein